MTESTEDLRLALSRIRENLGRRTPEAPAALEPVPAAPAPVEEAVAAAEEPAPEPAPRSRPQAPLSPAAPRPLPRQESFAASTAPWRAWAKTAGFALAAAGAVTEHPLVLATGLLLLAAEAAVAAFSRPAGPSEKDDVLSRLGALEDRAASPEVSGSPRELQEEIRELRLMVKSLYAVLEKPAEEGRSGEDSF